MKRSLLRASFFVLAGACSSAIAQLGGSAQLTSIPSGGQFHDTIVVHNTGTTTIGTFWFAWIPGENFLPSAPADITSPPGWTAQIIGGGGAPYSILWYAPSPSDYIPIGGQLSGFGFSSADSPATLQAVAPNDAHYHVTDSYFYVGQAFSDPGILFRVGVTVGGNGGCGSADFNCDGDLGTDADIEGFFACLAGSCPAAPCTNSADFNGDGDLGTDADIEAFFRVLSGGAC